MKALQRDVIQNYPGGGSNPSQQTFILMWNPAISSTTIHNHIDSIAHIDNWGFNWSVHEWEKAHEGDRFFMVRVGDGKTGIVMSGIFISDPYTSRDWNRVRKTKEIHYLNMQPNFIVNLETKPIITTAQLHEAIPDFEWSKGHSGILLAEHQARKLEELFAGYLHSVEEKADGENIAIKPLMDSRDMACINAVLQIDADKFFQLIDEGQLAPHLMTDTQLVSGVNFPLHYITMCWDVLLSKYNEYSEEYKDSVFRKKIQNDRIKEYFEKTCGLQMNSVPYADYHNCFYCINPEATVEDILDESENELLEKGYLKKDIDLHCGVYKMDFEITKCLLEEGANPETIFDDEDECESCWEHVCAERVFF
ncbi:MAG: hypothetical protein IJ622_03520 [Bacteroidales bacterium]|nr:hypothetical protein [Bacteroidales bacterium]